MPFNDPGSSSSSKIPLDELMGALLLIDVHEHLSEMETLNGPATPIRADVFVLDGAHKADEYRDTLLFGKKLQAQLRGSIGAKVIGRLGKGTAQPGKNAPWELTAATAEDKVIGERYLSYAEAKAVADEEPF